MNGFAYLSPATLKEAVSFLSDTDLPSRPFAGGTDLLVQLRSGAGGLSLQRLVDVKNIPQLNEISYHPDIGLTIGAAVTCADICGYSPAENYHALIDGVSLIGGRGIQERATLGGNLCNAAPSADAVPALIVLGATAHIAGLKGNRSIKVKEFCKAPGKTALRRDELLVSISIPVQTERSASGYLRFTPRHEMDIAVAGAAARLVLDEDGESITGAGIALSAVAPVPLYAREASEYLIGKPPDEAIFRSSADIAAEASTPISDVRGDAEFRKHLVRVLTRRALQAVYSRITQEVV